MEPTNPLWSTLHGPPPTDRNLQPTIPPRAEGTEPANPLFTLLHGFTQSGASFASLLAAFSSARASTDAPPLSARTVDLPGHGRSGVAVGDLWDSARRVAAIGSLGVVVGYSMGGRVALHIALDRITTPLDGLVLIGATAGLRTEEERSHRRADDEALASSIETDGVESFLEQWLRNPLFATLSRDDADLDTRRNNVPSGLAASLRFNGTGTQDPLWNTLHRIACPTLILAGELDTKFRQLGAQLVTAIGPNATLDIVPGAGHACHLERPDIVARLVTQWQGLLR